MAHIGPAPEGWIRAERIGEPDVLDDLERRALLNTGPADTRTVGVMMMWRYADLVQIATSLFGRERRVPVLDPPTVAFVPYGSDDPTRVALASSGFHCLPDDPDVGHSDARPVTDIAALRMRLVAAVERYVQPAIEPMRHRTHLGEKALWGIAAWAALIPLTRAFTDRGDPEGAIGEVEAILAIAGPLAGAPPSFEVAADGPHRHLILCLGVCCRAYRYPAHLDRKCPECPLRPRAERIALQLEHLTAAPA